MTDPLFVVGRRARPPFDRVSHQALHDVDAVRTAYAQHGRARWLVVDAKALALVTSALRASDRWHRLLLLDAASIARRELLHTLFRVVIAQDDGVRLLPPDELVEVLSDERAEDLFIGGVVDREDDAIVLYRGNLDRIVVPTSWFEPRPKGPRPDFDAFAVTDFGQTIQLGEYEASADALLYELDPEARRRMKRREIEKDDSFGGALRRLRLAKGLSRSDFAPIAAKTIARIERNEVEAPRGETLVAIARKLGVKPDDIATY